MEETPNFILTIENFIFEKGILSGRRFLEVGGDPEKL
jgi:hypothetical protein